MASFSKTIETNRSLATYQDVRNVYDWLINSIDELKIQDKNITEELRFYIGDITCNTKSFSEFIEHAYGVDSFKFSELGIFVHQKLENILYISLRFDSSLYISTSDKIVLENFCNILQKKETDTPTIVYNIASQNNNTTTINGNNNAVVNQSENVNINTETQKTGSKFHQWLTAILQNLLANWIWYLLTLLAGGFISYLIYNTQN